MSSKTSIKFRRDTAARWEEVNPVLAEGEPGYEKDTGKLKLGDGTARWMDLNYIQSGDLPLLSQELQDHINSLLPHIVYDDGPSLLLIYQNAKV